MNPSAIFKIVTEAVVSAGVGTVVTNAIKATTPSELKLLQKISIGAGAFVLSTAAAAKATDFVQEQVQALTTSVKDLKTELQSKKKQD